MRAMTFDGSNGTTKTPLSLLTPPDIAVESTTDNSRTLA